MAATAALACYKAAMPLPAAALRLAASSLLASALAGSAGGVPVEQVLSVPVTVHDIAGREVSQPIVVTLTVDDSTPQPRPLLLISHGRPPDSAERASMGRSFYTQQANWFARLGFAVAVPVRVGYGPSGGPDVENAGACANMQHRAVFEAAARQGLAVIEMLRQRPDIAPDRTVILGQSVGGAATVALAAMKPPGVVAAINFAGGGGGNPRTRPQDPCSPWALAQAFGEFGKSARMPMLWIYTENDRFFGARVPFEWFDEFTVVGGNGEFLRLLPYGDDGHNLFRLGMPVWKPHVLGFLRAHGFPALADPVP